MSEHIQFLKDRLAVIEKRIAASEDYKEAKVLKRMIAEMEGTPFPKKQPDMFTETAARVFAAGKAPKVETTTKTVHWPLEDEGKTPVNFNRNRNNTPINMPIGRRCEHIYSTVEKIVQQNGGEMELELLKEFLHEEGIDFINSKDAKDRPLNMSSYITSWNHLHPERMTLEFWPKNPHKGRGGKRKKYEKIIYIGNQRLSA